MRLAVKSVKLCLNTLTILSNFSVYVEITNWAEYSRNEHEMFREISGFSLK